MSSRSNNKIYWDKERRQGYDYTKSGQRRYIYRKSDAEKEYGADPKPYNYKEFKAGAHTIQKNKSLRPTKSEKEALIAFVRHMRLIHPEGVANNTCTMYQAEFAVFIILSLWLTYQQDKIKYVSFYSYLNRFLYTENYKRFATRWRRTQWEDYIKDLVLPESKGKTILQILLQYSQRVLKKLGAVGLEYEPKVYYTHIQPKQLKESEDCS